MGKSGLSTVTVYEFAARDAQVCLLRVTFWRAVDLNPREEHAAARALLWALWVKRVAAAWALWLGAIDDRARVDGVHDPEFIENLLGAIELCSIDPQPAGALKAGFNHQPCLAGIHALDEQAGVPERSPRLVILRAIWN